MKTSEYMDKQITGHSPSRSDDFSDSGDDDSVSPRFAFYTPQPRASDIRAKVRGSFNEALITLIDQKMKEHTAEVLRAVDGISSRLTQLERRTRVMEDAVDVLKESLGNYHGITDGKLRELENLVREVQNCTVDIRDKQDITLAQIQLTKLKMSGTESQPERTDATDQTGSCQETSSSVPQQTCLPTHVSLPQHPANQPPVSPEMLHLNPLPMPSTPSQIPEPLLPLMSQQQVYYQPPAPAPETGHMQYHILPVPHLQLQPALPGPSSPIQPAHQPLPLPPSPQMPQWYQPFRYVSPPVGESLSPQPADFPPMPPQKVFSSDPSFARPPNQWFERPVPKFHDHTSIGLYSEFSPTHLRPSHRPVEPSRDNFYVHGRSASSNSNLGVETSQLPTARILPQALPTASIIDSGPSPSESGNRTPNDDVVEKVVAMGFRRDLVRSTVRRIAEKGKPLDPNVVLDMLTNLGEADIHNERLRQ